MPQNDCFKDELISMSTCPITLDIFLDPVFLGCGHTFEREAIEHPAHNSTCPTCRQPFHRVTPALHMTNIVKLVRQLEKDEDVGIADFRSIITCPLTNKIFYDPVSRGCCTYTVERDMIHEDDECPCNQYHLKWVSAFDIKPLIDLAIKYFPELQNERHFKMNYFVEALRTNNRVELDKLCKILKSSHYLNAISEEKNYKGSSAVTQLFLYPEGLRRLVYDTALRQHITPEGFNAVLEEGNLKGYTAVFCLANCSEGRNLLMEDKELRAKITSEGLNRIPEKSNGVSAVFFLAKYCRQLLLEDQRLCHLINIDTLMHPLHEGPNKGESAYRWLRDTDDGKIILELLQKRIDQWMKFHPTVSVMESGASLFSTTQSESKKRNGKNTQANINDSTKRLKAV